MPFQVVSIKHFQKLQGLLCRFPITTHRQTLLKVIYYLKYQETSSFICWAFVYNAVDVNKITTAFLVKPQPQINAQVMAENVSTCNLFSVWLLYKSISYSLGCLVLFLNTHSLNTVGNAEEKKLEVVQTMRVFTERVTYFFRHQIICR